MFWEARRGGPAVGDWPAGRRRRGNGRTPVFYWPLAMPFLFAAVFAMLLLVALVQVGIFSFALGRLGIDPQQAILVLLVSLAGSAVNIPVARLRGNVVQVRRAITVFGMRYIVPVLTSRKTTIAVNVGGAVVPVVLSIYLIAHDRLGWLTVAAVAIVSFLVHRVARTVPGLGIAVPALLPGIFAALTALLLHAAVPHSAAVAGLAYVGGTLGTLIGADLVNLGKVRRLGAPVVSIGGAGTFDGVFITGIVAVLLAAIL